MSPSASDKYNIESTSSEMFEALRAELDTLQKPEVDLSTASLEEIICDVHRALYGNGGITRGIMYKLAESHVKIVALTKKQAACREQVVTHLVEDDNERMRRESGLMALCREYPKLATGVAVVLFFGISTLWSIAIQERQATKIEQVVLDIVTKQASLTKAENRK